MYYDIPVYYDTKSELILQYCSAHRCFNRPVWGLLQKLSSGRSWQPFNSQRSLLSRSCQVLCWLGLEIISCHCFIGQYTRPGFYIPIICQYNKTRRPVPDRGINMSAWKRSGRQELAIPPINGIVLRLSARDAGAGERRMWSADMISQLLELWGYEVISVYGVVCAVKKKKDTAFLL